MKFEPLPSPLQVIELSPLKPKEKEFIEKSRTEIKKILTREDPRYLLVVGPCSIHNIESAKEYGSRLKQLSDEVSDLFKIVMRVYVEKPRTKTGWTGMLNDPDLNGEYDLSSGITLSRDLLLHFGSLQLPAAVELLSPTTLLYLEDLISWGAVGARTSASQIHRQLASGLKIPIGFKNCTAGRIDVAVNAVKSASESHRFIGVNREGSPSIITTEGNPSTHIVLRGGYHPNYDEESIQWAIKLLHSQNLSPHLMVDCAHDNSNKDVNKQLTVFHSVVELMKNNAPIMGLMLESHLEKGSQKNELLINPPNPNISLTDPCLDWKTTEKAIRSAYSTLHFSRETVSIPDKQQLVF